MNLGIVKSKLPNAKGPYYPRSVPRQGFVRGLDYDLPWNPGPVWGGTHLIYTIGNNNQHV